MGRLMAMPLVRSAAAKATSDAAPHPMRGRPSGAPTARRYAKTARR